MNFLCWLLLGAIIIQSACATWVIYFSGPNEPNNSRHAYFYSVTAAVSFATYLHAHGFRVDVFSWRPCKWFTSVAYDGDGQRHTYVKKDKKYVWDEPGNERPCEAPFHDSRSGGKERPAIVLGCCSGLKRLTRKRNDLRPGGRRVEHIRFNFLHLLLLDHQRLHLSRS